MERSSVFSIDKHIIELIYEPRFSWIMKTNGKGGEQWLWENGHGSQLQ